MFSEKKKLFIEFISFKKLRFIIIISIRRKWKNWWVFIKNSRFRLDLVFNINSIIVFILGSSCNWFFLNGYKIYIGIRLSKGVLKKLNRL
jgi:hypothetical protein